jgi:hypothetical protein
MAWLPWKPYGDDDAGLKLGHLNPGQRGKHRRLVPWWVRAMRRAKAAGVMRRQSKTSRGGRRPPAETSPGKSLWTAQRGQAFVPAQSA